MKFSTFLFQDDLPSPPPLGVSAKLWGPKRLVELWREPGQPLGIAIFGGKVDMAGQSGQPGDSVMGIFIQMFWQIVMQDCEIL